MFVVPAVPPLVCRINECLRVFGRRRVTDFQPCDLFLCFKTARLPPALHLLCELRLSTEKDLNATFFAPFPIAPQPVIVIMHISDTFIRIGVYPCLDFQLP